MTSISGSSRTGPHGALRSLPIIAFPAALQVGFVVYVAAVLGSAAVGLKPEVLVLVPVCLCVAGVSWATARSLLPNIVWLTKGIEGGFLICALGLSLACLSYVGAKAGLPLCDRQIALMDRWLGFDWLVVAQSLDRSPVLLVMLDASYSTFTAQLVVTAVLLLVARRDREIDCYFVTFVCASLFAELASMVVPTLGPIATLAPHAHFEHLPTIGRTTADIVLALRSGELTAIDLRALDGIISFPSLHAAVAVLVPYHLRWSRTLFWPAAALNALMLVSAVPSGNHYLSDVLGGIVVAALAIASGRALQARLVRRPNCFLGIAIAPTGANADARQHS